MDHVKKVTARANKQHAKLKSVGVVPHSKPVPWCTFFVLLVFVSCPPLLFITLFSAMGYGVSLVASFGDDEQTIAGYCSIAIGGIMSSLYLLDFSSWTSAYGRFMRLFLLIFCAVCMVIYLLLSAKTAPSGLIILYTLGTVGWFIASKHLIFSKAEFRDYVSWLTGPLLLASVVTLTVFMIWVKEDVNNEWNDRAKVSAQERLRAAKSAQERLRAAESAEERFHTCSFSLLFLLTHVPFSHTCDIFPTSRSTTPRNSTGTKLSTSPATRIWSWTSASTTTLPLMRRITANRTGTD